VDAQLPRTASTQFFGRWLNDYEYRGLATSLWPALLYLAWPWLTLATLMIFSASMRRAKVRTAHVLRCALYSCDAALWLVPLTAYASVLSLAAIAPLRYSELLSRQGHLILAALIFTVVTTYRLAAAYALYLRFHRPLATAAAAQLIVLLAVIALLLNIG
jgi:hypothetical protein